MVFNSCMQRSFAVLLAAASLVFGACSIETDKNGTTQFELIDAKSVGIDFENTLTYTEAINPYTYKSFFNGGGVGAGDLDNDGLVDLIFTGNQVDNSVYKNLGDFKFQDISAKSGLVSEQAWSTGVTLGDVNGDGWLDVYLCKSGPPDLPNRTNELRINNQDGTFSDVAAEAGVADFGLAVHAAFLDFDRDGDLDLYLLNNSIRSVGGYDLRPGQREKRDTSGSNKLYRNELIPSGTLRFTDVSADAGIYGSDIGFGLGVTVSDVNLDGWPDLYVSNDFFERDYLYLNAQDGSFKEQLVERTPEISMGAMGADAADLNGDGYPEIFVTEMRPASASRFRSKTKFETWSQSASAVAMGYHRQYSRNTLLYNRGGETFSDVSRFSGVEATDWSWGALLADLDNDGLRDIYVANGIYKDLLDQDYISFVSDQARVRSLISAGGPVVQTLIDSMPSEAIPNYAYRNLGDFRFVDSTSSWGLDQPSFSNGSVYADLDLDGDLDLIVSTVNSQPLLYRNAVRQLRPTESHFLSFSLKDTTSQANKNHFALGARVEVYAGGTVQYGEVSAARGFMSSVDHRLHFGLGNIDRIDSVRIFWPLGQTSTLGSVPIDVHQTVYLVPTERRSSIAVSGLSTDWKRLESWLHKESDFNDFDRYPLLIEMISAEGPAMAIGQPDEGDTLIFLGGGRDQAGGVFRWSNGRVFATEQSDLVADSRHEDVSAVWFDADGDGDDDLFVGAGSHEFPDETFGLRSRLYFNLGRGQLRRSSQRFVELDGSSCGAVLPIDLDGDRDLDLLFGTHFRYGRYGVPTGSFAFVNDGSGAYTLDKGLVPALDTISRVRAMALGEFDGREGVDFAIGQEYGSVSIYSRSPQGWTKHAVSASGMWRSLATVDLDGDGIDELIAGNLGLNTVIRASVEQPLEVAIGDYDGNGTVEQITSMAIGGQVVVAHQLFDMFNRMPSLRRRFPRFRTYVETPTAEFFRGWTPLQTWRATELRSGVLAVTEGDSLKFTALPHEAQFTCIRAIAARPLASRGWQLFLGGNYARVKPEFGGQLGGVGVCYQSDGTFNFVPCARPPRPIHGEIRHAEFLDNWLLVARNDDSPALWHFSLDH